MVIKIFVAIFRFFIVTGVFFGNIFSMVMEGLRDED